MSSAHQQNENPPPPHLMSSHYIPAPPLPEAAAGSGVGLGYGIAIAVGILVLVSTIMLASYVCVRVKGAGPRNSNDRPTFTATVATSPAVHTPAAAITVGLDESTIESYPNFLYGSGGHGGSVTVAGPCPICLSEYRRNEMLRSIPECEHVFHAKCVDEWLRVSATCPLCRNSPVPSAPTTPVATPLSELIPLAVHAR